MPPFAITIKQGFRDGLSSRWIMAIGIVLSVAAVLNFFQISQNLILRNTAPLVEKRTSSSTSMTWQPKSGAQKCDKTAKNIPVDKFKSQSAEDKTLLELFFDGICGGTYLEMGGLDGVMFSNTYMFHNAMGWKGVLVEASPRNFAQLVVNRPNEIATVHAGVCQEKQDLHWVTGRHVAVGAFSEYASKEFLKKWSTKKARKNATVVKCEPLKTLLPTVVEMPFFFDFFSLDIEGAELAAILSIDFNQTSFGVIFVEADGRDKRKNLAVRMLLQSKGYEFLMDSQRSYWFMNRDFYNIYSHLIY